MPDTPALFTPYNNTIRNSLATIIAEELGRVPVNTREVLLTYDHTSGTVRVTTAIRIDRDSWAIGFGGYVEHARDTKLGAGIFAKVTF